MRSCGTRFAIPPHGFAVNSASSVELYSRPITASEDNTARVWNARTSEVIAVLKGHVGIVWSGAFTASMDKTARIWNAKTGVLLAVLKGHGEGVDDAVFSPDGVRIATASEDKTTRIWNSAETGDAFAVACAALGNEIDLADLAHRYGLTELKPICGANAPNKVNFSKIQD